jgi:high affinity Mn2+ porin
VDRRARRSAYVLSALLCASTAAKGQTAPAPHEDEAFDLMNVLTQHGLHDIHDESWNLYGQYTYISVLKLPFHAPYTNANGSTASLSPSAERSYTGTFTLFLAARLWRGGEAYFVPEVIAEQTLSGLKGIGGATENFELQKTGGPTPALYRSRMFLRQTFGLGGERVEKTSDPMQLGTKVDTRRLLFTLGNFSDLDVFDRNNVVGDLRQSLFNEMWMTHSSWDFPADARGYSWGAAAELYWDDWAVRFGRLAPPQNPNAQPIDPRIWLYYGDALELEHDHTVLGQSGAVRILGYRNYEVIGRFADAIAAFEADPAKNAAACASANLYNYGSGNVTAPDLCWVRKANVKLGIGFNVEQHITHDVGVFARGMYSDGQTEVDAFDSADRDFSIGTVVKGGLWRRPFDVTGAGFGMSWISDIHAQYLAMGGVDGFIGDGKLPHPAGEGLVEFFYSVNLLKAIWFSADYQHLWNPAYNTDRGPVNIFGGRVHAEF